MWCNGRHNPLKTGKTMGSNPIIGTTCQGNPIIPIKEETQLDLGESSLCFGFIYGGWDCWEWSSALQAEYQMGSNLHILHHWLTG